MRKAKQEEMREYEGKEEEGEAWRNEGRRGERGHVQGKNRRKKR